MNDLNVRVVTHTPLFVGGDIRRNTNANRPLLKTPAGLPYIPATTIKGRLRAEVERLLKHSLGEDAVCRAPSPQSMCHPYISLSDSTAGATDFVCPVCSLFGSPWIESRLVFSDLMLAPEYARLHHLPGRAQRIPATETRTSVSLNRSRRTAEEQRLFETELFEPGIPWTFEGTVQFDGTLEELIPVLLASRGATMLGGSRSRGLGKVTITLEPVLEGHQLKTLWERWVINWSKRLEGRRP